MCEAMWKSGLVLAVLAATCTATTATAVDRRDAVRNQDLADGSVLIEAPGAAEGDHAGYAIAVLDDLLIVGAPHTMGSPRDGKAFIHNWNDTTDEWDYAGELSELLSADVLEDAFFGYSVDIHPHPVDGVRVIVGAPWALNESGERVGKAFLFRRSGGVWSLEQTLDSITGIVDGLYGDRVAMNDTFAFVTAAGETNASGGSGNVWATEFGRSGSSRRVPLPDTRGNIYSGMGHGLAHDGSVLVIGAPYSDLNGFKRLGQAYVYYCDDAFPVHQQTLNPPSNWVVDLAQFGFSIAIDSTAGDGVLLIGVAPLNINIAGGAVSYTLDQTWVQEDILMDSDPGASEWLGYAVALRDDLAVLGSLIGGLSMNGKALVFRHAPTAGVWQQEATINPELGAMGDSFGGAVAIGSQGLFVGAEGLDTSSGDDSGGVFAYMQEADGWQSDTRPVAPVLVGRQLVARPEWTGPADPSFGRSIAISGNTALVGDPNDASDIGAVHVYTRPSDDAEWSAQPPAGLVPPSWAAANSEFGYSVAIDGDLAIVGAPNNTGPKSFGWAQLFQRTGDTWSSVATMTGNWGGGDAGWSVDIESGSGESFIAIGARDGGADTNGVVYLWRWDESTQLATLEATFGPNIVTEPSAFGQSVDLDIDAAGDVVVAVGNATSVGLLAGSVDILRRNYSSGTWSHEQTIEPGDEFSDAWQTIAFGWDVVIEDGRLVVGAPRSALYGERSGDAMLFRASAPSGPATWSLDSYLDNPTARAIDYFGMSVALSLESQQVFIGSPYSDYMRPSAGLVAVFERDPDASWSLADWINTRLIVSSDAQRGDLLGYRIAQSGTTLLATATCAGDGWSETDRAHFVDVLIEDIVCWTDTTWPYDMSNPDSWAVAPDGASTGVFSLLLAESHLVTFDLNQWLGSLRVELDEIQLELLGKDRRVTGSINVGAPADIRTAGLAIQWGTLHVAHDVHVGSDGNAGILRIDASGVLNVTEQLSINAGSSLQLALSDTMPGPRVTAWTKAPELGGGLRVDLGAIQDPAFLVEGDRFVLISSGLAPAGGLFDAIILPGLTEGLAFEVQYGAPGRSGGGCPTGEMQDCFGNCFPASWLGDGVCDDGSWDHNGTPIYLNCDSLGCDGGDCAECWNDGGGWEMAIEVVSLAGLLDFGDPNSTTVDGDPTGVEVVDLTGDLAEEICVTLAGAPGSLVIFENDGAGGVAQQIVIPTGDEPVDITSGDFDGDGRMDLAVANSLSQDVAIYYNDDSDPSDGFVEEDLGLDGPPTCLAGINADFNMYGDLAVGIEDTDGDGNGTYAIYLGSASLRSAGGGMGNGGGIPGGGTPLGIDPSQEEDQKDYIFTGRQSNGKSAVIGGGGAAAIGVALTITEYTTGADPGGITVGDFNDDGRGDICVTSTTNDTVAILLQDPFDLGAFLPAIAIPIGNAPTRITAVDFDNDGNLDLAAIINPEGGDSFVRILQGDGALGFTSLDTAQGEGVVLVADGDISGDGANELVTIGGGSALRNLGGLTELTLRETSTTCPGDFDATGDVNVDDLLILLGEFSSCTSNCQADMNGDGIVDVNDMLMLLGAWGPC